MNFLLYSLYVLTVGAIRVYKWIEYGILLCFKPLVVQFAHKLAAENDIVFQCPNATKGKDTEKMISATPKRYEKVLRIKVNDDRFFVWLANTGTLGGAEAYMHKLMDVFDKNYEDLAELITRTFQSNLTNYYYFGWNRMLEWLELYAFNLQTRERVFQVGKEHYDLGEDLYKIMLDPWMQYTCGYWKNADNLNDAQLHKMELIAKKLYLKPGMRVLDIGCGFGTLCKYLAENYGVTCVGITISVDQANLGRELVKGLPVDIRIQDYREINEKFDRIVSVGMFEHVGYKNYRTYMKVANRCLKDDGIFLLHTIGRNHINRARSDPFSNKYIFPNGMVPSVIEMGKAIDGYFIMEDWHNFSLDYAKTLYAWRQNFVKGWPTIQYKYGELFFRMWIIYLCSARAFFKSRKLQLWQIVLSKDGFKHEYRAPR